MKNRRNYYRVLHVQPDAPREIIRSSYKTLMQKMRMHPDLGGDGQNAAVLNEAYHTLTDPQHRAAYDKSRLDQGTSKVEGKPNSNVTQCDASSVRVCPFCQVSNDCSSVLPIKVYCANCQSPLYLARKPQFEEGGRRTIARIPNNHDISFCTHWPQGQPYTGHSDDISLNGMKFYATTGLNLGQIIKIDSQILRAVARVTRCQGQNQGCEIGVQFVSLCFEQTRASFIRERA